MLEVKNSSVFKIKSTASVRNILGETFFILDSETGKQYNLTEMEYDIVDMISKGLEFGAVVDKIVSEYNATEDQIEADLKEYYISLFDEGLILE